MRNKIKIYTLIAVLGVSIFSICLTARGILHADRTVADSTYSITLNSSNKYSGSSTKMITTDSKNYEVKFSYYNCSTVGGSTGHVIINNGGTVKNADHILSISSILPTFSASSGAILQFRASYDTVKWGDYATLTNEQTFDLSTSKPYYLEFKAVGGPVTVESIKINYLCTENSEAETLSGVNWKLILKNDEIEYDKEYILASINEDYALSTSRNESTRATTSVTSINGTRITKNSNGTLNINDDCEILTLKRGNYDYTQGISNSYAFQTHDGKYLNADSSQRLSLKDSINWYSSFSLQVCTASDFESQSDFTVGSIDAQCVSSGNHNRLSFTSATSIFGCRTIEDGHFTKSSAIGLYKKIVGGSGYPLYPTKITATDSLANGFYVGDIFANTVGTSSGLNVTLYFSDKTFKELSNDEFTYVVKNSLGTQIDPTVGFTATGTYTVTIVDNTYGFSYSYNIVVSDKPTVLIVDVQSVSVSPKSESIYVGETASFTATVSPSNATNKKVAWESSDSGTALVDPNGVVTALKAGRVDITARTLDGSFTDSAEVVISNKPVTSISLNEISSTMTVGGADLQLTATINQDATIQTISWSSSNQSVATVSEDGKVHAVSEGNATITATANGGLTATCAITVEKEEIVEGLTTATFTFTGYSYNSDYDCYDVPFAETENAIYGEWEGNNVYGFESNGRGLQWANGNSSSPELVFYPSAVCTNKIVEIRIVASNNKNNTKSLIVYSDAAEPIIDIFDVGNGTNVEYKFSNLNLTDYDNDGLLIQIASFPTGSKPGSLWIKSVSVVFADSGVTPTPPVTTKILSSISIDSPKTSFTVGDEFEFGGTVTAHYDDGTEKTISSGLSFSGYNLNSASTQTVTVSYTEGGVTQTATYSILVLPAPAAVVSISVSGQKTEFTKGDSFIFGGVVTAHYDDGSSENVTDYATFYGFNPNTTGNQTITVTYIANSHNYTTTYTINVKASSVTPSGDDYQITFAEHDSDNSTNLTESSIRSELTTGSEYIDSFSTLTKVYQGEKGLKMGSSKGGGYFTMYMNSTISGTEATSIQVDIAKYGNDSGRISIFINGNSESIMDVEIDQSNTGVFNFDAGVQIESIKVTSSSRIYLKGITIYTKPLTPISPSAIAITPSSLTMTRNETASLKVTYTPSNANTNKGITWSSNNSTIASVSTTGVVTAKTNGNTTITATSVGGLTSTINVIVKDIDVTGVTVSPDEAEISIGSTKQLTATVSPYNATNQNVTWSSTNSAVASVDNTGLVTARAAGTATIKATSATSSSIYGFAQITVTEKAIDKWTIMMYVCGADLESESHLASGDFEEILKVSGQPNDVNIIIQTGGASSWASTYGITANANQRYHVENKRLVCDNSKVYSSYKSMGQSSTFADFVTWGLSEYPAEKTGVILWNHGGGMRGVCYDERSSDDSLLNAEVKSGMATAFANVGRSTSDKLEFIGYDACLMQAQDIAEFNSQYFNYMVASQESEAGYGWDYDNWIDDLYAKSPTETILRQICDTFITDNGGVNKTKGNQTLSYLNLAYMPTYKTAFESFAAQLKSTFGSNVSKNDFYSWMHNNVKFFGGEDDDDEYFGMFDVKDFLNKIASHTKYSSSLDSYRNAALNALNNLVAYSTVQKGAGNAYGLCCIYSKTSGNWLLGSNYGTGQTNFSNWRSFVTSYGAI